MPRRDLKRARRVIAFIEEYCRVPEGQHVGNKLKLEPFQKEFIIDVYANPHGTSHGYLSIARKNGKTVLMAAIMLAHLVGPEAVQNSQIVSGARSRDQAALLWSLAAKMVELEPRLADVVHIVPSAKKLQGLLMNTEFKALSADGSKNMGLSPILALLDEVGQVVGPTDYFTDAIVSGQGAHERPLLLAISTQSPSDSDMFSIWIDDAIRSKDPHTVCHLHTADEDTDLMDEKQWHKANPALGKFLNKDYVRQQMTKANRLPSEENKVRNLHLNNRISLQSLWLAPKIWQENSGEPNLEVFQTYGAHIGLDLSQRHDLTSATLAAEDEDGKIHIMELAFTPKGGLSERAKRDRVPYDQWARDGVIQAVPGDVISYDWVCAFLREELDRQNIMVRSINFDRWRIVSFKEAAEREGFAQEAEWLEVGQGYKDMSPRVENMEELLLARRIRHGGHPVLNLGAASAIIVQDPTGSRKPDKTKSSQKIDGIISMLMAVYPFTTNDEQFEIESFIV